MSKQNEISNLVSKISQALVAGKFEENITYIRFPFYKNIRENTKIDFDFPLTVFIGPNGSGKSSALHALWGAPEGYSTGTYWFSTNVDPIQEGYGNPNCFVYGYKKDGDELEVLKTRVKRENPDNWEPSRPLKKYGMKLLHGRRNPAIKKDVVYIDFRSELSAFDKFFHFGRFNSTQKIKTKQDVVRKYSRPLKQAIDTNRVIHFSKRENQKPDTLDDKALKSVSKILSKDYSSCTLINHNFFSSTGLSVYFKTPDINYSEAFAGRGEFAVVKIVNEVLKAPKNSLIILDEPEVSLHPKAQEELKIFLLEQILQKELQVIISSHSPQFAEFLPETAIKLFYQDNSGKFLVKNKCNYIEAFAAIGLDVSEDNKNMIIVEDVAAKFLIEAILKEMGNPFPLLFKVSYYPGGAAEILKKAANYSEENEFHKFLFLDGDQRKEIPNPESFTGMQMKDFDFLKSEILRLTGITFEKIGFRLNSNSSIDDKINVIIDYLNYLNKNFEFLSDTYPENLLWNSEFALSLLANTENSIVPVADAKVNFLNFSKVFFGDIEANSFQSSIKLFINKFIAIKGPAYLTIVETLKRFLVQVQK